MRRTAAAKYLTVSPDMLLRLERRGLFHPLRDLNGHRRYTDEDLARLRRLIYPEHQATSSPSHGGA
jgi:DNA-binding transcriptional MerR regulator